MRTGRVLLGLVAFWGAIGVVLAVVALSQPPSEESPPAATPALRTVVVSDAAPSQPSSPDGPVEVALLRGDAPSEPGVATVLSDENCEPDANGYSHCLNELEMEGGERIAVRHTHRMGEVPCLAPGERVNVRLS
ncbi:MAG TPA: hypothetical protein VF058_06620 [Actinomycetota bacterium]